MLKRINRIIEEHHEGISLTDADINEVQSQLHELVTYLEVEESKPAVIRSEKDIKSLTKAILNACDDAVQKQKTAHAQFENDCTTHKAQIEAKEKHFNDKVAPRFKELLEALTEFKNMPTSQIPKVAQTAMTNLDTRGISLLDHEVNKYASSFGA